MDLSTRKTCRLCGSSELELLIDFGNISLTGNFPKFDKPDAASTPIELIQCKNCKLVQLRHSVDTSVLYTHDYGYRSGVNETMRNHLSSLARDIEGRVAIEDGDVVVDIAANDGTLLGSYENQSCQRVAIDPIVEKFRDRYRAEDLISQDYFSEEVYRSIIGERPAKVVTSISVFYDIEDPTSFARDISSILDPDSGMWVLEQSYLPTMIELNSFDTICQEHITYYSLHQIKEICERANLKLLDVTFNDINGGSFRVYVGHKNSTHVVNEDNISRVLNRENSLEIESDYLKEFGKKISVVRETLSSFLRKEQQNGKSIYIYGASTKGNMIVQYCQIGADQIVAAADRNPEKWGRRLPGTLIPIVSEAEARKSKPDYFLALPWHFKDEFLRREREFLEAGGKFIFPLPEPVLVGKSLIETPLPRD